MEASMEMDAVFRLSGLLVMPFWLLMIFAPRSRVTELAMRAPVAPVLPALAYLVLVAPRIPALLPALMQPKLAEVSALLGSPAGATIGWIHFLALDAFVGRWIYLDSKERGISAWLVSPVLFATLMFGPIGLLAYLGLRAAVASRRQPSPAVSGVAR
ncbi:MAG TPA: ABA4-like family protein [Myxococcales bacterium]|nr:ABA4-like family protein [Myxococcales bacterium]